jgi:transposase
MAGRPTKLTPERQRKIIQALSVGATYDLASKFAGISYMSFNNWRQRGEAEIKRREGNVKPDTKQWIKEQPFVDFFYAVKEAEGAAAVKWLAKIEAAANEQWQAAAWKLERRYPGEYGRTRVEHSGPNNGPIEYKFTYPDDDN